ncbi:ATP-grasp domain-containing protein [Streptomyces sp. TLI_053]|uniref:ATP-grasp domain-containing protein n=1 Tax=Streptomyces sp. TLI_053 TaxID=1855352 RepID=UPI001E5A86AF|nr:ATP-grasp domain-containing protein [Streptomyces sp. TLI_053]
MYLGAAERTPGAVLDDVDESVLLDHLTAEVVARAARDLHRRNPVGVVITVLDEFQEVAAVLNEEFGLTANSADAVRTTNDKYRMRTKAIASTCAPVAHSSVRGAEDLRAFGRRNGYPFILKPVDGSASRGITLVDDESSMEAAALAFEADSRSAESSWIAEEFLCGPEFSVETFSGEGHHHVLAVTEKFKTDNFVEVGHLVPARIADEDRVALEAEVTALLDAVGLTEGPAHTEVVLTSRGPRVVETHSRPGGDGIVELVRLATGLDMQQLTFDWLAGKPVDLRPVQPHRAAATWFLIPPQGTVATVTGLDEALKMPGVTEGYTAFEVGDVVLALHSSDDRGGAFIAVADDPETALTRAQAAASRVEIAVVAADAEPAS